VADVVVADRDGQRGDDGAEPLGDGQGLVLSRLRQQDREFLPAEPARQVVAAHLLAQDGGDRPQRLVADQVAVSVVDPLEVIEVQ
jgi:hypothetical protein